MYKNNNKLKPCPFCGGQASIQISRCLDGMCHYKVKYVQCKDCEVKTQERVCDGYYGGQCTDEEIARIWNERVSDKS